MVILYINLNFKTSDYNFFWKERLQILSSNNSKNHLDLADKLYLSGNTKLANDELKIINQENYVLGVEKSNSSSETLLNDVYKLKKIIIDKPNWSDAYKKIAYLEYQLGNLSEASKYAQKILSLNPEDRYAKKIINISNP